MRQDGRFGILLSQAALCLVLIASAVDQLRVHGDLADSVARQQKNNELIGKIDNQLDALARGTQALAQSGDANAAAVTATLAASGVHINAGSARR
ncbi:hypothetical protein [Sphingomonas bacterium]|uniref:hypothetical protein n=1 Tax=Sphingomonas bacterium TaxID=1895847 RepID=UPI0015773F14|nr:hypothetical protein [Sphingomonas bacterium]